MIPLAVDPVGDRYGRQRLAYDEVIATIYSGSRICLGGGAMMSDDGPDRSRSAGYWEQLGRAMLSFGERPLLTSSEELDRWRPDVAIVGAPFDINVTNRPGARFGPRALRAAAYHPGTYHLDLEIEIFDHLEVIDYGDAICPHGQSEPSLANIEQRVGEIAERGIIPITIGGDHSISWPAVTAVARAHGWGDIGVIHFDAHADTADHLEGNLASHGAPMRRLIESGAVTGENFIQIGLRGYWPDAATFEWARSQGMRWHRMEAVHERGLTSVMSEVFTQLQGCPAIYVSVDIDVLDPGFAPGTGTPEPGGMSPVELLRAIRRIALELPVVGMDLVEVAPAYDHADITVNNAHRIIFEALSGLAVRRRDAHR